MTDETGETFAIVNSTVSDSGQTTSPPVPNYGKGDFADGQAAGESAKFREETAEDWRTVPVYVPPSRHIDDHDARELSMALCTTLCQSVKNAADLADQDNEASQIELSQARRLIARLWDTCGTRQKVFASLLATVEIAVRQLDPVSSTAEQWKACDVAVKRLAVPFVPSQAVSEVIIALCDAGFDLAAPLTQEVSDDFVISIKSSLV